VFSPFFFSPRYILYALVGIVVCMILLLIGMTVYCVARHRRRRARQAESHADSVELMAMDSLDHSADEDEHFTMHLSDDEAGEDDASLSRYERWKKKRDVGRGHF
jgi:flagellar biosynthesis/type III secretory pathway M-ring protein FliF/YscJ